MNYQALEGRKIEQCPGRAHRLLLLLLSTALGALPSLSTAPAAPEAPASSAAQPEAHRAHLIELALEEGRVAEALVDAETAVKRFPESGLLRLRLAQAEIAEALQLDRQFGQAVEDAAYAPVLDHMVQWLRKDVVPSNEHDPEKLAKYAQDHKAAEREILTPENLAAITQFQDRARGQLKDSGPLLARRTQALVDAFAALKEARRLENASTERELTDLWAQVVALLWRGEIASLGKLRPPPPPNAGPGSGMENPLKEPLAQLEKALAPFVEIKEEMVLRAAADLARDRASDAEALAGAADVIAVVAGITGRPDPLRAHLVELLDHRYLKNTFSFVAASGPGAREMHRRAYLEMRDARDPDGVSFPATVVLQLYRKAWQEDAKGTLPYLRLRLYLLEVAFDREEASKLLEEVKQQDPHNAVPALEQARAAFLLDDKPDEGFARCREAAQLPGFSRSYLVAAPAALRTALKFQRGLREWVKQAWPGYGWLLETVQNAQWFQLGVPILGGPRPPASPKEAAERAELQALFLKLADLLCQAPDYADQAQGLDRKASALEDLLNPRRPLPPAQRALVQRRLEELRRAFANYPSTRGTIGLSANGLDFSEFPHLGPSPKHARGPQLWAAPARSGTVAIIMYPGNTR